MPSPAQMRALLHDLAPAGRSLSVTLDRRGVVTCATILEATRHPGLSRTAGVLPNRTAAALLRAGLLEATGQGANEHGGYYVLSDKARGLLESAPPEAFVSPKPAVTDSDILAALRALHDERAWVFFTELRAGTGYGKRAEGRIDAWALNCWPSSGYWKIAYEVKISRADFLRELKHPDKRAFALEVSNQFFFACPPGVASAFDLPGECGLLVYQDGALTVAFDAPKRAASVPDWGFVGSLARDIRRKQKE